MTTSSGHFYLGQCSPCPLKANTVPVI